MGTHISRREKKSGPRALPSREGATGAGDGAADKIDGQRPP